MMKSIRDVYKVGRGPSSSHTMGPAKAAALFREETPDADAYRVVLYGSLSKTGRGHGTDRILVETFTIEDIHKLREYNYYLTKDSDCRLWNFTKSCQADIISTRLVGYTTGRDFHPALKSFILFRFVHYTTKKLGNQGGWGIFFNKKTPPED